MSSILELIPPASARQPLSAQTFTRDFLPAVVCYYATAVLVLIPRTFAIRLALLPVTLAAAFRAGTQLDFAAGYPNEEQLAYLNQGLTLAMTTLCMRVCIWTFQQQPLERRKSSDKTKQGPESIGQVLLDALDLAVNLRGIGWTWSRGLRLPAENRNVKSTSTFLGQTLALFLTHIVAFDFVHYAIQSFGPTTFATAQGGTVFDASLNPFLRHARSFLITWLGGFVICFAINTLYLLLTLISVGLFGQSPSDWPPVYDKPWTSTSLNEYWTIRWHQLFRDCFISFGGKPIAFLTGRVGGVIGAFAASGLLHDFGLWGMGRGSDFQNVGGFFLMMGVGVILEHSWKAATGERVGGFFGFVWTMAWVLGWGQMLVEAWALRGLIGSLFIPDPWRPSTLLFGPLVSA